MISDIEVGQTEGRGLGVFARRAFASGEFLFRRHHVPLRRSADGGLAVEETAHVCQVDVDEFAVVSPPGCYMNHSCAPNALRRGVNVVAWSAIAAGEEITLDYRLNAVGGSAWRCRCGADACSRIVEGGFFGFGDQRQRELLPFAGDFVKREYRRRQTAAWPTTRQRIAVDLAGPAGRIVD